MLAVWKRMKKKCLLHEESRACIYKWVRFDTISILFFVACRTKNNRRYSFFRCFSTVSEMNHIGQIAEDGKGKQKKKTKRRKEEESVLATGGWVKNSINSTSLQTFCCECQFQENVLKHFMSKMVNRSWFWCVHVPYKINVMCLCFICTLPFFLSFCLFPPFWEMNWVCVISFFFCLLFCLYLLFMYKIRDSIKITTS